MGSEQTKFVLDVVFEVAVLLGVVLHIQHFILVLEK